MKENVKREKAKENGISYKPPDGTKCAICGTKDKIVFDHDHKTKAFRGYICDTHNRSIGYFNDSIEGVIKIFNYLNKYEKKKLIFDKNNYELKIEENEDEDKKLIKDDCNNKK